MPAVWPRPQRLLPPHLLEALEAAQSGDAERALQLVANSDASDALAGDVVRLVRGLAALESGAQDRALRLLRPLLRDADATLALAAALALAEQHMRARRFSSAAPLLQRARRHACDDAAALVLDSALLRLELMRRGQVDAAQVARLPERLRRCHPAAVHAAVHLLGGESALLQGDLESAVRAEREARPYVTSARQSILRHRHRTLSALLDDTPFVEVEDWQRPLRPLSRGEVAALAAEPWQLWVDGLHRRLRKRRGTRSKPTTLHFARDPDLWETLAALLHAQRRRLSWEQARRALRLESADAARELARRLAGYLSRHGVEGLIAVTASGCEMRSLRFVHLYPTREIPRTQQLLLALLAEHPVAPAQELARLLDKPQRTLLRHLGILRRNGFVRLAGGGRQTRYQLV